MNRWSLYRAVQVLRRGGIVAYPTEAVYGLGCDPGSEGSVCRLRVLKRRGSAQGFILIGAEFEQVAPLVRMPGGPLEAQIRESWPGHITWVLPADDSVPRWLVGPGRTLAVRVTRHPLASALCKGFGGPIVSTSANSRGVSPARTALGVRARLPCGSVDYVLSGRLGGECAPSEIRDSRTGKVLRKG